MRFLQTVPSIAAFLFLCPGDGFVSRHTYIKAPACLVSLLSHYRNETETGLSQTCKKWHLLRRDFLLATFATGITFTSVFKASGLFRSRTTTTTTETAPFARQRQYREKILSNGLRVLLVLDDFAPRSSVALTVGGAGQFSDATDLPGIAHLSEHMTLSSVGDFDGWISDRDGGSNGFTAPGMVAFHFTCPNDVLLESLANFSGLFSEKEALALCSSEKQSIIKREVRRVDSELDDSSDVVRAFYLLKKKVNPSHPFARLSGGNLETLEKRPKEMGINVGERLADFFHERYLPDRAVLVAIGNSASCDFNLLERSIAPFANGFSSKKAGNHDVVAPFPEPFPKTSQLGTTRITVLLRPKGEQDRDENVESLVLEWPMSLVYSGLEGQNPDSMVSAAAVGFIIAQILGRRGPGSLYSFLLKRGWVTKGNQGVPRISLPVDVSGFQILKMEIGLTLAGFANRSAVLAAIHRSIQAVSQVCTGDQSFLIPQELFRQYITVAMIHGYYLTPRPPDAVEMAVDAQIYGLGKPNGVGVPELFPIMPRTDEGRNLLRKAVGSTLSMMSKSSEAIITITASLKAIVESSDSFVDQPIPPLISPRWNIDEFTGARYIEEDVVSPSGLLERAVWVAFQLEDEELGPPVLNPLVPSRLRSARLTQERLMADGNHRFYYLDEGSRKGTDLTRNNSDGSGGFWRELYTQPVGSTNSIGQTWEERAVASRIGSQWQLFRSPSSTDSSLSSVMGLPLPVTCPEPTLRCAFLLQLLSSRPACANVKQAGRAELWLRSFDDDIMDLAELGTPAGMAYDASFNAYGLRICFRGISQTLPSYVRRFMRRLMEHNRNLRDGSAPLLPSALEATLKQTSRLPARYSERKGGIMAVLRDDSSTEDVAAEGEAFLNSCNRGLALAEGDLLPDEAVELLAEIKQTVENATPSRSRQRVAIPELKDILYKPLWKPRTSSSCLVPGVSLISNACGRIQR